MTYGETEIEGEERKSEVKSWLMKKKIENKQKKERKKEKTGYKEERK